MPDSAASLIQRHEELLFARAYPRNPRTVAQTEKLLSGFARRIERLRAAGADLSEFEDPEVSGIAGTALSAVFSYEVVRQLVERHGRRVDIDWDWEQPERLGHALQRLVPLFGEDWPVEASVPYREWVRAAAGRSRDLQWLADRFETAELFDALSLLVRWDLGNSRITRTRLRIPTRRMFYHSGPLLRRSDVSLAAELESPPLPLIRLPREEGRAVLELAVDTSAMRYRELYGFTHGDPRRVLRADAGRGVVFFLWGVPPEWRLPLRAYHAVMMFKNGVPIGYAEALSLFERAELGFNMYYTFRAGESAWIYARILRLLRQVLGVNVTWLDPYQIGFENEEAIHSGAFWFYRKLGFRPVRAEIERLAEAEERKLQTSPGYRCSARMLHRLAESAMIFEPPGTRRGDWDCFAVRTIGLEAAKRFGAARAGLALALQLIPDIPRWSEAERHDLARILRAKSGADEARYLRLMQRHTRLRRALLRLGS